MRGVINTAVSAATIGNRLAWAAALLVIFVPGAYAHHSAAPHFDLSQTVTLDATITKFEFVNPHGYVYFTVPGSDGKPANWRCELPARTALGRLGWTPTTFSLGDKVKIKGAPARREENVCMLNSFIRPDGREINRTEDLAKIGLAPAPVASARPAEPRPARLADGHPNFQGTWVSMFGPGRGPAGGGPEARGPGGPGGPGGLGPGGRGGRGPGGPPGRPEVTAAEEVASKAYDQRFDDPAIKCSPANILFGWTHDQHVNEIIQKPDTITLKYGYMDFVRTIPMNVTEHPKDITPSLGGHSFGKWDGDVLVVDTVGFQPGVLIPLVGLMHSGEMHVVERFSLDPNTGKLTRTYRADDPLYFKSTYTGMDIMNPSTEPFTPYNCVELSGKNNIRPK